MSLLIDALRRAEEAKRAAAQGDDAGAHGDGPVLPPVEPAGLPPRNELQRELNALDKRPPRTHASPAARARPADAASAEQSAARNIFEVKEAQPRTSANLTIAALTLLAVIGIAAYFWWQLQPAGHGLVALTPPRPAPPPMALTRDVEPRVIALDEPLRSNAASEPLSDIGRNTPPAASTGPSAAATARAPARQAAGKPARDPVASRGSFGDVPAAAHKSAPSVEPPRASIPIRRGTTTPAVPLRLQQAWSAYQADELEKAYGLYRGALEENSRSTDALNGLGAISLRLGDEEQAAGWFRQTLRLDPNNAVALAGLGGVDGARDANDESRIRNLIAAQPGEPALRFALGNVYAAELRWNEAQQAYFDAYSLQPSNPDYRFNLAISLDRLGQRDLARRFYLDSVELTRTAPAAFDPAAASARARALGAGSSK